MAKNKTLHDDIKRSSYARTGIGVLGIYILAYIGAAVYYVQLAHGFRHIVWALIKALVWPAYLIHALLQTLHL